ncbi:hypothetical protein HG430_002070 [Candidatus Gracilibacteria bacterium]|nr:hypothetical protein [Candidatus Gracilibacteria bacterium]
MNIKKYLEKKQIPYTQEIDDFVKNEFKKGAINKEIILRLYSIITGNKVEFDKGYISNKMNPTNKINIINYKNNFSEIEGYEDHYYVKGHKTYVLVNNYYFSISFFKKIRLGEFDAIKSKAPGSKINVFISIIVSIFLLGFMGYLIFFGGLKQKDILGVLTFLTIPTICSIFLTVYLIKKGFDKSLTNFEKYFVVNNENDYLEEKELKGNFHKIIFDFYKNTGWILEFISLNKDMYGKNIINLKLNLTEIFNDIGNNKSYFFLKILLEIDEMTKKINDNF